MAETIIGAFGRRKSPLGAGLPDRADHLVDGTVRVAAQADAGEGGADREEVLHARVHVGDDEEGERERDAAEQRTTDRGDPTDHRQQHHRQALEELEGRWRHAAQLRTVERSAEAGDGRRQREDLELRDREVDPQRHAGGIARLHREEATPELLMSQPRQRRADQPEHHTEQHQVGPLVVEGEPEEIQSGDLDVAVGQEQRLVEEDQVHEHGERGGAEGEVEPPEPQRGKRHDRAGRARDERCRNEALERAVAAPVAHHDRPDPGERHGGERDLAGPPDQGTSDNMMMPSASPWPIWKVRTPGY